MASADRLPRPTAHSAARSAGLVALLGLAAAIALTGCSSGTTGSISPVSEQAGSNADATSGQPTQITTETIAEQTTPKPSTSTKQSPTKSAPRPSTKKTVSSDVSQLKSLGIDLNKSIMIDVADDGLNAYLEIGKGGVVDFTGRSGTPETMMSLKPAQVTQRTEATRNRVVIAPPFYNEDLGAGSCIADQAAGKLRLATCSTKAANQVWRVVPAGDSGQFELHGVHTEIRVNNGRITTGSDGYVGLQTIEYKE